MPMVFFYYSDQNDVTSFWVQKHARAHAQIYFGQEIFEIYPKCTEYTHDL